MNQNWKKKKKKLRIVYLPPAIVRVIVIGFQNLDFQSMISFLNGVSKDNHRRRV